MFDKTIFQTTRTEYVPYDKTIIEKRAPTDESIRIWEEMKEKAYRSILGTIDIKDNTLNVAAVLYKEIFSCESVCKYRLLLNGKEITGEVKAREFDIKDKSDLYRKIIDDASRYIAVEIAKHIDSASIQHNREIIK